jgi:hypothetical protein
MSFLERFWPSQKKSIQALFYFWYKRLRKKTKIGFVHLRDLKIKRHNLQELSNLATLVTYTSKFHARFSSLF